MFQIFDWLQILLWTAVYITVVFNGIKYRHERPLIMPYLPGALNFAWEVNAFSVSGGMPGHILWLGLDTIILVLNIRNIRGWEKRILYLLGIGALILGLWYIFSATEYDGMLISAFIIDLIMALVFVLRVHAISKRSKKSNCSIETAWRWFRLPGIF